MQGFGQPCMSAILIILIMSAIPFALVCCSPPRGHWTVPPSQQMYASTYSDAPKLTVYLAHVRCSPPRGCEAVLLRFPQQVYSNTYLDAPKLTVYLAHVRCSPPRGCEAVLLCFPQQVYSNTYLDAPKLAVYLTRMHCRSTKRPWSCFALLTAPHVSVSGLRFQLTWLSLPGRAAQRRGHVCTSA
jgi:hypothetical protein